MGTIGLEPIEDIKAALNRFKVRTGLRYVQGASVEDIAADVRRFYGGKSLEEFKAAFEAYTRTDIEVKGQYLTVKMVGLILSEYSQHVRGANRQTQNRYQDNAAKFGVLSDLERRQIMLDGLRDQFRTWRAWREAGSQVDSMPIPVRFYTLASFLEVNGVELPDPLEDEAQALQALFMDATRYNSRRSMVDRLKALNVQQNDTGYYIALASRVCLYFDQLITGNNEPKISAA